MASKTINNNTVSSSPTHQSSFTGSTPSLASLANATEPNSFSVNQQQTAIGTFPQRPTGGSPTANNGSPFGASFPQASTSGSTASFQFGNSSSTTTFPHPSANPPRFSFNNIKTGNSPNLTFDQPIGNSQIQQPLGSFTFNSSTFNQETSTNNRQQTSVTDQKTIFTINNTSAISKKLSDPPTPVSEQSSSFNQEQEEADAPASVAVDSLLSKKLNTTLRDSNTLVVDRSDPNSPLFSLTTFEQLNLKPELLKGIFTMGFRSPSKIQAIALPSLLGNPPRNIIAQSQSGTGKTAAFSLAILSRIDPSLQYPQALILAPTFELALQIGAVIEEMARFLPYIQIAYAVRETISNKTNFVRGQLLSQPIVVGTPGTVEDWCRRKRVIDLSKLRICCVDEADVMISIGDFQQTCVNLVHSVNPSNCQMMLFSATYSDEVMTFARQIIQNPTVLRLKREKQALSNINQYYILCYDPQQKYKAIQEIYLNLTVGQAMIFCRTKATVRELAIRMSNEGHSVRELTSALDIEQRASVIKLFREGTFRVLISTNVTARGLDIEDVSLVINYDMPVTMNFQPDYETYLHRIGRCGRFGKIGNTFNLIGSEKDFNTMKQIEEYFSHPIQEMTIEGITQLGQDEQ